MPKIRISFSYTLAVALKAKTDAKNKANVKFEVSNIISHFGSTNIISPTVI